MGKQHYSVSLHNCNCNDKLQNKLENFTLPQFTQNFTASTMWTDLSETMHVCIPSKVPPSTKMSTPRLDRIKLRLPFLHKFEVVFCSSGSGAGPSSTVQVTN